MNKHTPAPWSQHGQTEEPKPATPQAWTMGKPNVDTWYISTEDHNLICMLSAKTPEARSNAALIAAAPELLEALKAVTLALEVGYTNSKPMRVIVAEANAAIAKAQG